MSEQDRQIVRMLVRAREDFQDMRKRLDNRLGRKADGKEQDLKEADKRVMSAEDVGMFGSISNEAGRQEDVVEKDLVSVLSRFRIWNEWLINVKGLGTIAGGWIVGEYDIHKAETPSALWQFTGLNPGMVMGKKRIEDSKGNYNFEETGIMIRGDKLTPGFVAPFNQRLRTAIVGVFADNLVKAGMRWVPCTELEYESSPEECRDIRERRIDGKDVKNVKCRLEITSPYVKAYLDYKNRLLHSDAMVEEIKSRGAKPVKVKWKDAKPAHIDRAAKRYMIKQFLKDLYVAWRTMEGLEVRPPYQEEKLGHKHTA